jgi:hypothetical protein
MKTFIQNFDQLLDRLKVEVIDRSPQKDEPSTVFAATLAKEIQRDFVLPKQLQEQLILHGLWTIILDYLELKEEGSLPTKRSTIDLAMRLGHRWPE